MTPPTKAIEQRALADLGIDRARPDDVEEGDDAGDEARDREGGRDHPVPRTPTSCAIRKSSVDARSWMPSVVRFRSSVIPTSSDDRDDDREDLEARDQHAADVELVREPRVRLDALLRALARPSSSRDAARP